MARVGDVAAFVLEQGGTMTTFKLHKLLYYAQGWSLIWEDRPLFDAKLKAYENGPVVSSIFSEHRGQRHISRWAAGNSTQLTDEERDTVRAVLEMYGGKSPAELVEMTHAESPWCDVWTGDKGADARVISLESMRAFFTAASSRVPGHSAEGEAMGLRLRTFLEKTPARGDT